MIDIKNDTEDTDALFELTLKSHLSGEDENTFIHDDDITKIDFMRWHRNFAVNDSVYEDVERLGGGWSVETVYEDQEGKCCKGWGRLTRSKCYKLGWHIAGWDLIPPHKQFAVRYTRLADIRNVIDGTSNHILHGINHLLRRKIPSGHIAVNDTFEVRKLSDNDITQPYVLISANEKIKDFDTLRQFVESLPWPGNSGQIVSMLDYKDRHDIT